MSCDTKPYRVEYFGIAGVVWAASAGKARYQAALAAHDAGWLRRPNPSVIMCKRAPEFDHVATADPGKCYALDHIPAA